MSSTNVPQINAPGLLSPTKHSPTTNTKATRLPAPTLFVAPPSRNASQLSVARADGSLKPNRPAANRTKTARSRLYDPDNHDEEDENNTDSPKEKQKSSSLKRPSERAVDARWREMQNTLNEVELTAQSSTHVFGQSHASALDDLRNAQVALARAWGRGNEGKELTGTSDTDIGRFQATEAIASERKESNARGRADTTTSSASTVLSDESGFSENSGRSSGPSQLEEETAQDIKLASERRAANEAYFQKVDSGVREVVEKLERVAEAMRSVESESRSLWSHSEGSEVGTEGVRQEAALANG